MPTSINLRAKGGFLIAHRANMAHLPGKNTKAYELEFTKQDTTHNGWNDVYKNPLKGLSIQYQDMGNREVIGVGFSIFAHTTFPLIQRPKFGFLDFRMGTGMGFLTKRYHPEINPKNNAIGSYMNGFVNLGFHWHKYFEHWHIGMSLDFNHYSNSSMVVPNLGLNVPSLGVSIGYDINSRYLYSWDKQKAIECSVQNEDYNIRMAQHLRIFVIGSAKQAVPIALEPRSRPVVGISALYSIKTGRRWKVDFGLDAIYNRSNAFRHDTLSHSFGRTVQFGAYVGSSIHYNKAEFALGLGVYFYSPVHPYGYIYNRLGFRYHFTEKLSGIIGIKAHLAIADYLEIGIGYKLWQGKCK